MELLKEIEKMKEDLVRLADTKKDPLKDIEIYEQNCAIDEKIVEFIRRNIKVTKEI